MSNSLCQKLYINFFAENENKQNVMLSTAKMLSQLCFLSLDFCNIFVRNNVSATGCYMCICFKLHLAKLIATPSSF